VAQWQNRTINKKVEIAWMIFRLVLFMAAFTAGTVVSRFRSPAPPTETIIQSQPVSAANRSFVVVCDAGQIEVAHVVSGSNFIKVNCLPESPHKRSNLTVINQH
jgi:hypothetical protein